MNANRYRFCVPKDHPVLTDHFPGNPLVPGAFILDHVIEGLNHFDSEGKALQCVKVIKFKSPLRGGEWAEICYESSSGGIRFMVLEGTREIASGLFDSPLADTQ